VQRPPTLLHLQRDRGVPGVHLPICRDIAALTTHEDLAEFPATRTVLAVLVGRMQDDAVHSGPGAVVGEQEAQLEDVAAGGQQGRLLAAVQGGPQLSRT
jgi:hypothetical protein